MNAEEKSSQVGMGGHKPT